MSEQFMGKIAQYDFIDLGKWQLTDHGVFVDKITTNKSGEIIETKRQCVSSTPILPTALYTNIGSGIEKIEISFFKFGKWKSIIVPRSTVANKTSIVKLSDNGIEVTTDSASLLVRYIAEVVAQNIDKIPHKMTKSVMGWEDSKFVPYTEDIIFDGEEQFGAVYKAISQKGSLSEWVDFISPLRTKIEFRLAMAASFASPLIELVSENPFCVHVWGQTGSGKTVCLLVAMSIWGNPAMGALTRTMNMTANSMMSTAAFLRNLPFAGDELQTIKSRWGNYDNLIMQITEGVDRGRMSFDKLNEMKEWKCAFLFSGEEPCIKHASGGGAKNRVIEIEIDGKLIPNGNAVASFVRKHYGCAAPIYIDALKNIDVQEQYAEMFNNILDRVDTTDKQAGAMALLLVADKIASDLFFQGESALSIDDVKQYLASQNDVNIAERAYQFLCDTVAENTSNFNSESRIKWGRIDMSEQAVYFNSSVLNRIFNEAGFDIAAMRKEWTQKGYLVRGADNRYRFMKTIYGTTASYYKIKLPEWDNISIDKEDTLP